MNYLVVFVARIPNVSRENLPTSLPLGTLCEKLIFILVVLKVG
ncbi:MAG TPA: hypothetical protein VN939_13465 [Chthoniobacterales bacterium]|nr:hypothetical protein [Chthoniobacterales bacterium]